MYGPFEICNGHILEGNKQNQLILKNLSTNWMLRDIKIKLTLPRIHHYNNCGHTLNMNCSQIF